MSDSPALSKPQAPAKTAARKPGRRAFWLKQLHTWHWISSAISLIGLLLFAITGYTLNHASDIEADPVVAEKAVTLPAPILAEITADKAPDGKRPLPPKVAEWLDGQVDVRTSGDADWSADEVYLAAPRPGGDGWIAIDRATGGVTTESTDRGWIAYLNDLHKGRDSGPVWSWFIDIFALACLVFALTGLVLLWLHSKRRPSTWPLVIAGLAIPAALAVFFIH